MRASFCAVVSAFLIGCAGGPAVDSSAQASQTGASNGTVTAGKQATLSPVGTNVAPTIRVVPCARAACIGLVQQERLDPVQLANDWGRPDLVDQIKVMTDEANATLDPAERDLLIRALYTTLDTLAE